MKRNISVLVAVVIAGLSFAFLSGAVGAKASPKKGVLSINDIQADPAAYKGTVTINGVVSGPSRQDPKVFGMIDTNEAILCKTTHCARFYLFVKYEGQFPQTQDEVNVTGEFIENGRMFKAAKVEVVRHLTF